MGIPTKLKMEMMISTQELKLKQASVALGVPPKDLQNFVQAGVLRPRRRGLVCYFDRKTLVSAKVAFYLKNSLGTSTRYLSRFTKAIASLKGFPLQPPETVCLRSRRGDEQPVSIFVPLRTLVDELDQRLPMAARAKDLPRGRRRRGWRAELTAVLVDGAANLKGVSSSEAARAIRAYRRGRKADPTVVAEAVEATT
jgi:hypothetical protein